MRGNIFVWLLISVSLTPAFAAAQPSNKTPRIVFLSVQPRAVIAARYDALRQGLQDLGYVEGKNIIIEYIDSGGSQDRLSAVMAEVVRRQTSVIVSAGAQATQAAKEATSTIPIVMAQDTRLPLPQRNPTLLMHRSSMNWSEADS